MRKLFTVFVWLLARWSQPSRPPLECLPDLILKSGATLHAVFKYWVCFDGGLITWKSNPMGITQGRTLLSSLNLNFGAISHGQNHELDHVSERLAPSAEEGYCLRRGIGGEPLEFEPTIPHQGHALDAEKVLAHGWFLPRTVVLLLIPGGTASHTSGL